MRIILIGITTFGMFLASSLEAYATVHLFACEPEWASLAKEIGGDQVETFSATTARQDPHHMKAKPSLIAAMRKANMVVCSGASLEVGWLPTLLQAAWNSSVQPGNRAFLMAADIVPVLEKPTSVDRSQGDVHPEGNPHVHLDPRNIALVAKELKTRLLEIDPANAGYYQTRYDHFAYRWNTAMVGWEYQAASLKGVPVVMHHKSFLYLTHWLGMNIVGTLEPKPGIPPTIGHLETLLTSLRAYPAHVIVRTPYEPKEASVWLSEKTGAPAIILPYTVGEEVGVPDLFKLFDWTIVLLKHAYGRS